MNKIEITDEHLQLIQKALELYIRCSIGQFESILDIPSIHKEVSRRADQGWDELKLESLLKEVHKYYTGSDNGGPSINHPKMVAEDARDAMNIHDQIRHHLWKKGDRKFKYTVDAYDAMVKLIEIE